MTRESGHTATHVLVVDDDEEIVTALNEALTGFGYEVSTADCGEKALELARQRRFDLLIADLRLQDMSGIHLTRAMCRMHPDVPVVIISAYGDLDACRQALEAGASDFLHKPLELPTLPLVLENNLQRKRLEAKRLSDERADVLFKAIKALAAAIDGKSHFAGSHSERMADLCVALGVELGLPHEQLVTLELAAHIHDVGKVATPDSVLAKPGKLSDDEWVDILKHPGIGADVFAGIDELSEVASVIRHHHEHVDGSGYPDGLKGQAIPFLARILAVADAFEAMTSERPYREAMTVERALNELEANAGTQFDPEVVAVAVSVIRRMEAGEIEKWAA